MQSACRPATPPPQPTAVGATSAPREAKPTAGPKAAVQPEIPVSTEVAINGVMLPVALTFAPDDRLFFNEVNAGRIRVASGEHLQEEPFASLPVQQNAESGLLGLALDPDFEQNNYVYAFYTVSEATVPDPGHLNRVVRFTERDGRGVEMTMILDRLPSNVVGGPDFHEGGAIAFGPDGKLYVGIGDTGQPELAQNPTSLAGKVLRINKDGSIPSDNPTPGSPIFASGFRNPYGFAFHPTTGELYASENGNKAHDEVNLVRAGGNYGWPLAAGTVGDPRFVDPVWDSGSRDFARNGMTGLVFYRGPMWPELQDDLLFCSFKEGRLRRATLEAPRYDHLLAVTGLNNSCRLGVAIAPDGSLYVSTINQILRLSR